MTLFFTRRQSTDAINPREPAKFVYMTDQFRSMYSSWLCPIKFEFMRLVEYGMQVNGSHSGRCQKWSSERTTAGMVRPTLTPLP